MPLVEYHCNSCGRDFENLASRPENTAVCPHCGKPGATRRISRFSAAVPATVACPSASACPSAAEGGCCGHCCCHEH